MAQQSNRWVPSPLCFWVGMACFSCSNHIPGLPTTLTNKALCNPVRNVMHIKEFREFEFGQHKRAMWEGNSFILYNLSASPMLVEFVEKHGGEGYFRQGQSRNLIHSDITDKAGIEHALGSSSAAHGNPGKCYVIVLPVPGKILKMSNDFVGKLICSSYIQRLFPLHRELHQQEWAAHAWCMDVSVWAQQFILNPAWCVFIAP